MLYLHWPQLYFENEEVTLDTEVMVWFISVHWQNYVIVTSCKQAEFMSKLITLYWEHKKYFVYKIILTMQDIA
jgi:hypothetical protein